MRDKERERESRDKDRSRTSSESRDDKTVRDVRDTGSDFRQLTQVFSVFPLKIMMFFVLVLIRQEVFIIVYLTQ